MRTFSHPVRAVWVVALSVAVLTGWSESGRRSPFDVVTGVSTGALMATHAFLGSGYDEELLLYTRIASEDIYEPRGRLAILRSDAALDTAPLRRLVAQSLDEAALGLGREDVHPELFLLNNDALYAKGTYKPVSGSILSISGATILSLMRKATLGSLYRVWVMSLIAGADFHISYIPQGFDLLDNSLRFDREEMNRLFELGRDKALRGEAWSTQRAPETLEELVPLIDPRRSVDRLEARPWLEGGGE